MSIHPTCVNLTYSPHLALTFFLPYLSIYSPTYIHTYMSVYHTYYLCSCTHIYYRDNLTPYNNVCMDTQRWTKRDE